jgi:hypothetical protein
MSRKVLIGGLTAALAAMALVSATMAGAATRTKVTMFRVPVFLSLILLTAVAVGLSSPAVSQANVVVSLNDGGEATDTTLAEFRTAKCRRAKSKRAKLRFTATAKPVAGFGRGHKLEVDIFSRGRSHNLAYGGPNQFTYTGPAGEWSNLVVPPNAPPGGGGIEFNRKMTRMGLGFAPAFSTDTNSTVSVTGGLKCKYPKKRRKRR